MDYEDVQFSQDETWNEVQRIFETTLLTFGPIVLLFLGALILERGAFFAP